MSMISHNICYFYLNKFYGCVSVNKEKLLYCFPAAVAFFLKKSFWLCFNVGVRGFFTT
jgi:hypothetical protein